MTTLRSALDWRLRTPFFYGWLILGVGALGAFVATTIAGVVLGGIQGFIFEDTGWSRSSVGLTATVGVWCSGLAAPFVGKLADRYGPRWLMPIGTFTLGICLFYLGGVNSIWQFFLAAVLARAISQPVLIGVVPRTVAVNFFHRKRNTALALTGMFRPISGAIIIQIISVIAVAYGWRAAFRYFGIMSILLTIPMVLIVRRRPEDIGLLPDGAKPDYMAPIRPFASSAEPHPVEVTNRRSTGNSMQEVSWTTREALHNRAFWIVAVAVFLSVTGSSSIGFNMVPYLHEAANISIAQATGILSLSTFLALASLGWGYLADKFTPRRCIIGATLIVSGSIVYLFTVNSMLSAYIFGVVWGITSGSLEVLIYMLLANYFGRDSYGAISGALRPFEAGGLGVGQSLGAIIYDTSGSYIWLIVASLLAHVVAGLLIAIARPPVLKPVSSTG